MQEVKSEDNRRSSNRLTLNVRKSVFRIRQLSGSLSPNAKKIHSAEKDFAASVSFDVLRRARDGGATSMQKIVRGYLSRKRTLHLMTEYRASKIIQKTMSQHHFQCATKRRLEMLNEMHSRAITIQTRTRVFISKARIEKTREHLRMQAELKLMTRRYEIFCHERASSMLLLKSTKRSLKYEGIMQALFNHWSSSFDKLDASSLVKMLREAPGVFSEKKKSKRLSIGVTDLDLIFVKKSKGRKFVTFSQFIDILESISEAVFEHIQECRGYSGQNGRMMELMFNHIFLTKTGKIFGNILQERSTSFLNKSARKIQNLYRCHHSFQSAVQKLKGEKRLSLKQKPCNIQKGKSDNEAIGLADTKEWFALHCTKCLKLLARSNNSYDSSILCIECFKI